jgi:hypothetical protein
MLIFTGNYWRFGSCTIWMSPYEMYTTHHSWHTNKCESVNQFITKFICKSYHLCHTIVGRACTYLAVSLDSVGYEEYY